MPEQQQLKPTEMVRELLFLTLAGIGGANGLRSRMCHRIRPGSVSNESCFHPATRLLSSEAGLSMT